MLLSFQASLMPTDDITVYYDTTPELGKVITEFSDFIFSTIKQPLVPYPVPAGQKPIIVSDPKKKDYKVTLTVMTYTLTFQRNLVIDCNQKKYLFFCDHEFHSCRIFNVIIKYISRYTFFEEETKITALFHLKNMELTVEIIVLSFVTLNTP
jgi:hypothetical protein